MITLRKLASIELRIDKQVLIDREFSELSKEKDSLLSMFEEREKEYTLRLK